MSEIAGFKQGNRTMWAAGDYQSIAHLPPPPPFAPPPLWGAERHVHEVYRKAGASGG